MYKIWSVKDIRKVLDEVSFKMGLDCSDIPIEINSRFKRIKGRCTSIKKEVAGEMKVVGVKIEISKNLISGLYKEEDVKHVIIHEYIHLYTNVTENDYCGHDYRFKQNCVKVGICEDKYIPFEMNKQEYKYAITCKECNKQFNMHRLTGGIDYYSKYYKCSKCGGGLSIVQRY